MTTTHTAGPWRTRGGSEEIWIMGQSGRLASVPYRVRHDGTVEYPHADEADANARLIAAAPDLLQAGKHLAVKLAEAYRIAKCDPAKCQAITEFMAAVAKVEGR
jgi:hypothetical protein